MEEFLHCGYAVIFLHRASSLSPFTCEFTKEDLLHMLAVGEDGRVTGMRAIMRRTTTCFLVTLMSCDAKQYFAWRHGGKSLLHI